MPISIAHEAHVKNDRMPKYKRLPCDIFSDILISGTASKRGNKYADVFTTYFGLARDHPMKNKGDSYEALSLLFQWMGVPYHLIVDGSKDQVLG